MTEPSRELQEICAACGAVLDDHVSNTGVVWPCWMPSGTFRDASPPPASQGAPEGTASDGDIHLTKRSEVGRLRYWLSRIATARDDAKYLQTMALMALDDCEPHAHVPVNPPLSRGAPEGPCTICGEPRPAHSPRQHIHTTVRAHVMGKLTEDELNDRIQEIIDAELAAVSRGPAPDWDHDLPSERELLAAFKPRLVGYLEADVTDEMLALGLKLGLHALRRVVHGWDTEEGKP